MLSMVDCLIQSEILSTSDSTKTVQKMVSASYPFAQTSNRLLSLGAFVYHLIEGVVLFCVPKCLRQRKSLENKVVLITGAASGIGQQMAIRCMFLGAHVILWDISQKGLDRTLELMKRQCSQMKQPEYAKFRAFRVDLRNRDDIYRTARQVLEYVERVDILVNNAGVVSGAPLLDLTDEQIEQTFQVNTLAHFYTVKAFLPGMITRGTGHIVTVCSAAGNVGCGKLSDYCASKFANVGFDLALRAELAQANLCDRIATTIVKPYFINTGMFSGAKASLIPFLEPDDVADAIVDGIQRQAPEIVIPGYLALFFLLLHAIPAACLMPLADFMGCFEFMEEFRGRSSSSSNNNNNSNNGGQQNGH